MRVLPLETLSFLVAGSPEVVAARLGRLVSPRGFRWRRPPEPFTGEIHGTRFEVTLTPGLLERNSFRPVIVGDIVGVPGGSEVRIRMHLQPIVAAMMSVWFAALVVLVCAIVGTGLRHSPDLTVGLATSGVFLVAGGAMLSFGYWFMWASFRREALKAEAVLGGELGAAPRRRGAA